MANLKTEVILTMNGKAAIQVLEALRDKAKSVREEIDNLDEKAPDFKQRKAGLEEVYKALQSAETDVIKGTERLDHALQNLTSTSLQNLRKALGDGRRQLQSLSEDDLEEIEEIRKKMKLAGDQVRLLEGQYVKIPDGLKNIKNQSDQWLDKAIKQQRDLVGSLEKSDASYQKNLSTLKQLVAEEDRRKGKMSKSDAMATVSNKYANASELRRAKTTITEVRDKTDSHKVDEIEQYNKALLEIDKRLGSISGQFVDVQKGISNVSNQSDQWLDKAIKQQRDLVGSLEKSDASYQQNLATLKQLEAEEDRRKGKMSESEAHQTVSSSNASASDLRRAKTTLTEARDKTALSNTGEIDKYNSELQEIEKRLEAVSGKAQKASMSWKQMKQVLAEPNKASGEDIKRTMEVIAQKIQQLPAGSKYVADLRRQYSMLEQTLKGTRMSQSALNDILTRSKQGKASIDELRRAYKQLEEELNLLNTKSKEFADKQKSMKELKKNIDEVTGAANKQGGAWNTALKNLTAYVGLFSVFNHIKDLVTGAIKKNFEYSGSLTDIRKVSGLTMDDVKKLSTELAKIDTRTSVDGLAQLAYEASKLGVGKYGVEGMAQFVRAADKINVAIGEEMGEKALPSLLKMTEVMGLIPKMGLERSIEAVGSAMFKLSSTSTATSNDITEFAKRCTGVARTAGITTDQLLALGSAFSAQMASPEVAATAMSKFIVALQKNHNLIEKDLAIPAGTINDMYKAGHAMDAIVLILEKMKEKGNMNALGEIFKDVGGDGQRLISSMVTMAKNVDMLKDHLYESQEAFEEATAVGKEYSMQQMSAIGILERANNLWEKAFVNPDGVDAVKGMAEWWYEMSATMTSSPLLKGTLQIALQMVLWTLKGIATLLPVIIGYMASQGVYSGLKLLYQYLVALGMAGKAMFQYVRALVTANAAQSTLNKTMKLNPWIALASIIIGVAGAIYGYTQRAREAAAAAKEAEKQANAWKSTLGQAAVETSNLNQKLANYKRMMSEANLSQKERQGLISRFNRDFHSYISKLGIEVKSVKDLRDHYSELAQEAQRATYYRMMEQAKKKALPKLDADRDAAANALLAQIQKMGIDKFGASFTDIDRWVRKGANGNAIFWRLAKMMPESKSGLKKGLDWKLDKQGFVYRTSYDGTKAGLADSHMQYELRDLLSAARWYANSTGRRYKKEKDIEDNYHKWFPKGYTPYPEEDPGTLDNNAPENNATTGSGHNPNRDEKNIAKDRANALIANIKAFYEEQMRKYLEWVAQMNADGEKISEGQQKEQLDYLQSQMDRALGTARQSIANLGDGWKQFYSHMDEDVMVFDDETSKQLLESIGKADVGELHKLFTKLSGDLSRENNKTLAENLGALLDQIFANGSKELREAAEKLLARQREIQKILNEHDYTGAVDRNTRSNFDRLGFLQPAKDIRSDSPEGLEKMNTAFDKLTTKARESITVLYSLNPESEDFQNHFLQFLSVANEGFDFSVLKVQDLKALYLELIKYNDEFAAAEKKQYDDAKKITDFLWKRDKRNLDQQEKMRKMQNESKMFGKRTNLLSNLGLANLTADPEIELMKARMQAAENYYAFVERNNKNQQLLAEAERARQEAELAYVNQMATAMKSRLSQMKELVQPIEDFGAAVGQALAEMRYDAESANDAIKSALKSMLESWAKMALNDVNTQMWKAINDAGAKRGKKNAQPDIEAARANADANAVTMNTSDIGTAGNPAHVIVDNETKPSDSISDKKTDVVVHSEPGGPDALPTVAHKDSPMATSPILVPNNTERHGAGGLFKSVDPDTMPSYPSKDKVSAELPVKIGDDNVVDSHSNSQEKSDLQHEPLSRVEEKRKNNFPSDFHPDQYPEITVNSKKESPVPTVDTKTYEPPANAALKRAHNTNNPQNEENREGVVGLSDIQENVRGILEVAKDLQSKVSDRAEGDVGSPTERTEEPDSSANSTSYSDPAHRTKKALPTDAQESQGKVRNSPSNQRKGSTAFRGTAEQAGSSVADAITGQSSLAEAGAGIVMGGVNAALNADLGDSKKKKKEEKQRKKQLREEKKHQKALSKEVKQGTKEREKTTDKGVKNMTVTTEQGNKEQSKGTAVAQQTMLGATDAVLNTTLIAKQKNNDAMVQSDAARTEAEMTFSIAGAMAKCFEFLGPIAGPIAAAVVMSTLMGLLQWALGSALGGKKKNSTKGPNTKVVSGMLTYDSGNVQDLRPFVGNDGSLYWATEDNKPHDGVSLLTQPTATTINGQPSLVAENGPELVIGRETTQAMMMNNSQLLKALVNYDRNYSGRRAYDNGNIAETSATITPQSPATDEMVSAQANTNIALLQAVNTLLQRLEQPIEAKIDMYGRGKLYDSMTKANQFMKNK
jgi:DNA repair exonuclease SbcCD ATPase subunit